MDQEQVVKLMKSATSGTDWNEKCDQVKSSWRGKYPSFWYQAIIASGLADNVLKSFGEDAEIRVVKY